MKKTFVLAVISILVLAGFSLLATAPAAAQPRPMDEDVFTPLSRGYEFLRDGNYEAAEAQFRTALERDRFNPFALNNLAVLEERKGNLKDAMAFLTDAGTYADRYLDVVEETCFVEGLCVAVKPARVVGPTSAIAPIIADNLAKLKAKVEATPTPPETSKPPKM
jgi:Flp pilus assembly protein TadD